MAGRPATLATPPPARPPRPPPARQVQGTPSHGGEGGKEGSRPLATPRRLSAALDRGQRQAQEFRPRRSPGHPGTPLEARLTAEPGGGGAESSSCVRGTRTVPASPPPALPDSGSSCSGTSACSLSHLDLLPGKRPPPLKSLRQLCLLRLPAGASAAAHPPPPAGRPSGPGLLGGVAGDPTLPQISEGLRRGKEGRGPGDTSPPIQDLLWQAREQSSELLWSKLPIIAAASQCRPLVNRQPPPPMVSLLTTPLANGGAARLPLPPRIIFSPWPTVISCRNELAHVLPAHHNFRSWPAPICELKDKESCYTVSPGP